MFSSTQYKTVELAYDALSRASEALSRAVAHARELSDGPSRDVILHETRLALTEIRQAKETLTNV